MEICDLFVICEPKRSCWNVLKKGFVMLEP